MPEYNAPSTLLSCPKNFQNNACCSLSFHHRERKNLREVIKNFPEELTGRMENYLSCDLSEDPKNNPYCQNLLGVCREIGQTTYAIFDRQDLMSVLPTEVQDLCAYMDKGLRNYISGVFMDIRKVAEWIVQRIYASAAPSGNPDYFTLMEYREGTFRFDVEWLIEQMAKKKVEEVFLLQRYPELREPKLVQSLETRLTIRRKQYPQEEMFLSYYSVQKELYQEVHQSPVSINEFLRFLYLQIRAQWGLMNSIVEERFFNFFKATRYFNEPLAPTKVEEAFIVLDSFSACLKGVEQMVYIEDLIGAE